MGAPNGDEFTPLGKSEGSFSPHLGRVARVRGDCVYGKGSSGTALCLLAQGAPFHLLKCVPACWDAVKGDNFMCFVFISVVSRGLAWLRGRATESRTKMQTEKWESERVRASLLPHSLHET